MISVHLRALEIDVEVADDRVYHDDGYVDSIYDYLEKLHSKYDSREEFLASGKDYRRCLGVCQSFKREQDGKKHIHVAYLTSGREVDDIFIRAHEETHALKRMGKSSALNPFLKREGLSTKIIKDSNEEVVASIGGLLACKSRSLECDSIEEGIKKNDHYKRAVELTTTSRRE